MMPCDSPTPKAPLHDHTCADKGTNIDRFFVFVFSFTLFLSASLMFVVEPMIGKMMLPIIGGAPSGWLVTMAYFQIVLLVGYLLALGLSRLPVRIHIAILCCLLGVGFLKLPIHFAADSLETPGLLSIFLALMNVSALPMIAISAISPSFQRLFALGASTRAQNPYFLFAASNLGSLGGLLLYPLLIERISGLSDQSGMWKASYVGLILFCLLCLAQKTKSAREAKPLSVAPALSWKRRALWVALSFIPSSLMLGLTASVTADTGSVPLFWVLPLALYLGTFILAFRQPEGWNTKDLPTLHVFTLTVFCFLQFSQSFSMGSQDLVQAFVQTIVFVLAARLCHGLLADKKPEIAHLSEYYVWIAVGGALGGMFNAFLAPLLFTWPIEFILVAGASCWVHALLPPSKWVPRFKYAPALYFVIAVGTSLCRILVDSSDGEPLWLFTLRFVQIISLVLVSMRPKALGLLIIVVSLSGIALMPETNVREIKRNFFGVLRVVDKTTDTFTDRQLMHGTTLHGRQQIAPTIDTTPSSYYDPAGPLGDIMTVLQPKEVGLIGLGTGATLCFTAPDRHFTVYEIDADVVDLASRTFDYMKNCGAPQIHIGDGRKLIEKTPPASYDLLIIDAFTSDAIPVHLLTREAIQLYLDRLKPNGILAIHISNRYYDLRYPLSDIASALGIKALGKYFVKEEKSNRLAANSRWVALASDAATLHTLEKDWKELPPPSDRAWSDDFSDTLSQLVILKRMQTSGGK